MIKIGNQTMAKLRQILAKYSELFSIEDKEFLVKVLRIRKEEHGPD